MSTGEQWTHFDAARQLQRSSSSLLAAARGVLREQVTWEKRGRYMVPIAPRSVWEAWHMQVKRGALLDPTSAAGRLRQQREQREQGIIRVLRQQSPLTTTAIGVALGYPRESASAPVASTCLQMARAGLLVRTEHESEVQYALAQGVAICGTA